MLRPIMVACPFLVLCSDRCQVGLAPSVPRSRDTLAEPGFYAGRFGHPTEVAWVVVIWRTLVFIAVMEIARRDHRFALTGSSIWWSW